jgi:hypothetical protein
MEARRMTDTGERQKEYEFYYRTSNRCLLRLRGLASASDLSAANAAALITEYCKE